MNNVYSSSLFLICYGHVCSKIAIEHSWLNDQLRFRVARMIFNSLIPKNCYIWRILSARKFNGHSVLFCRTFLVEQFIRLANNLMG